jgi:hypothetical protein
VVTYLCIEIYFEGFAVMRTERNGGGNIEIVEKVGNVKHNGVASLQRVNRNVAAFLDNEL